MLIAGISLLQSRSEVSNLPSLMCNSIILTNLSCSVRRSESCSGVIKAKAASTGAKTVTSLAITFCKIDLVVANLGISNAAQNVVNRGLATLKGAGPVPHKRVSNVKEREKENIDRIL